MAQARGGHPDYLILWSYAQGAAHDPELRDRGYGAILRDFYNRSLAGFVEGKISAPVSLGQMSHLVSVANRGYYAEQRLQAAIRDYQETGAIRNLEATMMSADIDAQPGAGFAYPAQQRIRFQLTTDVEGEPLTRWVTYEPPIAGPGDVGSLLDMAEAAGQELSERYGEEFMGIGEQFSITWA